MRDYDFKLQFELPPHTDIDALLERLGARCTDALVGLGDPARISLEFTRAGENLESARATAIADVLAAMPGAHGVTLRGRYMTYEFGLLFEVSPDTDIVAVVKRLDARCSGRDFPPGGPARVALEFTRTVDTEARAEEPDSPETAFANAIAKVLDVIPGARQL